MWLLFHEKLNDEDNLLMIGKALLLSQKFESTCKYVIMMMSLAKKLTIEDEFELMSNESKNYTDRLLNMFLGQSINYYQSFFKSDNINNDIEILKKAKDARNYICHESTVDFIYSSIYNEQKFEWNFPILKKHIGHLAEGDYYVSRLGYEIHERESGHFYEKQKYIERILKWIFDD